MDRDAMVLYLRDVRDLEVVKHWTEETIEQEGRRVNNRVADLQNDKHKTFTRSYDDAAEWVPLGINSFLLCIPVFLVRALILDTGILSAIFSISLLSWVTPCLLVIGVCLVGAGVIFFIRFFWEKMKTAQRNDEEKREVDEHNRNVDASRPARLREAAKLQEDWRVRRAELKSQHKKANELLGELYDMNILAAPYRDLVHVAYIYEYMSTSQATLEDTLLHEHMEDGFNRMERKLDELIGAVNRNSAEICRLRAENNATQRRRDKADRALLESLQRNEANTAEAARYARLNAGHSNTLAFFATVNYLEK